jgi:cystathionine beta-lyase
MLVLCSPHNPGVTVWSAEELNKLHLFCDRHGLFLVSDEIHHDLVYPGRHHTVAALAHGGSTGRLVVLTAATKTFNIAAC